MALPTMEQFTSRVTRAVAEQMAWAEKEFHFSDLPINIKIVDVPTGPLGLARVVQRNGVRVGYQVKFQSYHFVRDQVKSFSEYPTYNAWPEIGGFESTDWELVADALVAHELAHIIQYALKYAPNTHPLIIPDSNRFFMDLGRYELSHGKFFRQIYRRFRAQFINHRVPASAYTAPRGDFIEGTAFEERMEAKTGDHPLVGLKFEFKGRELEIVGRNPRNAKLFGYIVKLPDGTFSKCKLSLLCVYCPEAKRIVLSDPMLARELVDLSEAEKVKKVANSKSSRTKQRRAPMRKAAKAASYA